MYFEIVGEIEDVQSIAAGPSVRDRRSLQEQYGGARWRKLKGTANVRTVGDRLCRAEIQKRFKIKRFLEP